MTILYFRILPHPIYEDLSRLIADSEVKTTSIYLLTKPSAKI